MKVQKTNALRLLDAHHISYRTQTYEVDDDLSGVHVTNTLGIDENQCFKTLVLEGDKTGYLVCCIPVNLEIDLKKLAKASGNKKVEMIPMKNLLSVTGYIRGGCSPVGMKKQFPTYIQEDALCFDEIYLSAGRRGLQMIVNPNDIVLLLDAALVDVVKDEEMK